MILFTKTGDFSRRFCTVVKGMVMIIARSVNTSADRFVFLSGSSTVSLNDELLESLPYDILYRLFDLDVMPHRQ